MISNATNDALVAIVAESERRFPVIAQEGLVAQALARLADVSRTTNLQSPVLCLEGMGQAIEAGHGVDCRIAFSRALVATLAIQRARTLERSTLPESVLRLYPVAFERMVDYLRVSADEKYWVGNDAFLKDIRIASGLSVPCGAQDVDLISTISRLSGLKAAIRWGQFAIGSRILVEGGPPWYSIHTDQRYTDEFNEAGWDRCYRRIAALLAGDPKIKGMVGTSWFYDPQILTVSPRLAYLQINPTKRGAILLRHGPGAIHTYRATLKSESRKKLFDEGKYVPICYSLVWPRSPLMEWATSEPEPAP